MYVFYHILTSFFVVAVVAVLKKSLILVFLTKLLSDCDSGSYAGIFIDSDVGGVGRVGGVVQNTIWFNVFCKCRRASLSTCNMCKR